MPACIHIYFLSVARVVNYDTDESGYFPNGRHSEISDIDDYISTENGCDNDDNVSVRLRHNYVPLHSRAPQTTFTVP